MVTAAGLSSSSFSSAAAAVTATTVAVLRVAVAATTVAVLAANKLKKAVQKGGFLTINLLTQKLKSCIISVRGD